MSTSVKGVSTVMNSYVSNVGNAMGTGAKASFQDVWSNQTDKNEAFDTSTATNKKVSDGVDSTRRGEALKAKDRARITKQEDNMADKPVTESLDEKKLEEAMEVLGAAATELMQEIADAFGMTMEELEQLMADMNMEPIDVLNLEDLSALLLQAGGAADSLALLTDENLCSNFQMIMNRQKEMFAELSESLQMTPEQLTQFIEEMDTYALDEQPLQITVETDMEQNSEADALGKDVSVLTEDALTKAESSATDNKAQEQLSGDANEQTGNLLLQNLKADNLNPEPQQVSEGASVWNENTENIMRQIMDFMKIQVNAETSSLEMQLHPASLGTLQVQVASKGGVLTANFIAENETVKSVLESQMIQLKESFAEQGVKVEAIEVTVQTHQFERNLEQGRGRQQEEPERKGRTRRINLNTSLSLDEMDDMTQEEQLAAEIMNANGSTVDYTA